MQIDTLRGACLCEAVKFTVRGEPQKTFICYCTHCSKNAGGPGQASAKFSKEQVRVVEGQDLMKIYILYDNLSGSPKHKIFCGNCGCTLWTIPMAHGGHDLVVRTALIDKGLEVFAPKAEFFVSRQIKWAEDIPRFDTMPGAG